MPRDQSAPTVSPVGVQTPQAGAVLGFPAVRGVPKASRSSRAYRRSEAPTGGLLCRVPGRTVAEAAGGGPPTRRRGSLRACEAARQARDQDIRALLLTAQESIEAAWTKLEDA